MTEDRWAVKELAVALLVNFAVWHLMFVHSNSSLLETTRLGRTRSSNHHLSRDSIKGLNFIHLPKLEKIQGIQASNVNKLAFQFKLCHLMSMSIAAAVRDALAKTIHNEYLFKCKKKLRDLTKLVRFGDFANPRKRVRSVLKQKSLPNLH